MSTISVKMSGSTLCLSNESFSVEFAETCGGFPSLLGFTGEEPLLKSDKPLLSAKYNKRLVSPFIPDGYNPAIMEYDEKYDLTYDSLPWCFQDTGEVAPNLEISLSYEIYADGVVFVKTMFFSSSLDEFEFEDFILEPHFKLLPGEHANWAYWTLPREYSAALIQNLGNFERNLSMTENRAGSDEIFPFVSFDYGTEGRRDHHLEFFVEGWNSLTPKYNNTATKVIWLDKECSVSWNFHRTDAKNPGRALYWNNTWGWALRRAPIERTKDPLRIVHYLDNFKHLPELSVIDQVAGEGANLLIIHECWRTDVKNGAVPAVPASHLRDFIERCHKYNIRVALYVRGNEDLMQDDFGQDLFRFLTPDYDGIYMDFASPCCYLDRGEYYPGGRIKFRSYDRTMRRVRGKVGDNALLIGHSGSFFSAVGYTVLDAYVGGEQEKGKLLENPTAHSYFSGASVQQTSLWTAAFPTYRTKKMLPFMATAMQSPFVHLGVQLPCCSLAHPELMSAIPFARPLWRLWELFDGLKKYNVYSTVNCAGIIKTDGAKTGCCMLVAPDGAKLVIVANYAEKSRRVSASIDYIRKSSAQNLTCYKLDCNYQLNGFTETAIPESFNAALPDSGITAWLLAPATESWQDKLKKFTRAYPTFPEEEQANRDRIETIRKQRFNPVPQEKAFLRLKLFSFPDTYEDSLVVDLYANDSELVNLTNPDKPVSMGYITMDGIQKNPNPERRLQAGGTTPPVPLHKILVKANPGELIHLGIKSRHGEHEFYSFVEAVVTDENGSSRHMIYDNELDMDWSLLTFDLILKQ